MKEMRSRSREKGRAKGQGVRKGALEGCWVRRKGLGKPDYTKVTVLKNQNLYIINSTSSEEL